MASHGAEQEGERVTREDFEGAREALAEGPEATAAFLSRNVDERAAEAAKAARNPIDWEAEAVKNYRWYVEAFDRAETAEQALEELRAERDEARKRAENYDAKWQAAMDRLDEKDGLLAHTKLASLQGEVERVVGELEARAEAPIQTGFTARSAYREAASLLSPAPHLDTEEDEGG